MTQEEAEKQIRRNIKKWARYSVNDIIAENAYYLMMFRGYVVDMCNVKSRMIDRFGGKHEWFEFGLDIIGLTEWIKKTNGYYYKHKALRRVFNYED